MSRHMTWVQGFCHFTSAFFCHKYSKFFRHPTQSSIWKKINQFLRMNEPAAKRRKPDVEDGEILSASENNSDMEDGEIFTSEEEMPGKAAFHSFDILIEI